MSIRGRAIKYKEVKYGIVIFDNLDQALDFLGKYDIDYSYDEDMCYELFINIDNIKEITVKQINNMNDKDKNIYEGLIKAINEMEYSEDWLEINFF